MFCWLPAPSSGDSETRSRFSNRSHRHLASGARAYFLIYCEWLFADKAGSLLSHQSWWRGGRAGGRSGETCWLHDSFLSGYLVPFMLFWSLLRVNYNSTILCISFSVACHIRINWFISTLQSIVLSYRQYILELQTNLLDDYAKFYNHNFASASIFNILALLTMGWRPSGLWS